MKAHSKAQVAVEYLMTYGWAILVLILVLALLFSSGIFSPSYLISEECSLGPKLPCTQFLFNDGANLRLVVNVTNGFETRIRIKNVAVTMVGRGNMNIMPLADDAPASGGSVQIDARFTGYNAPKDSTRKFMVAVDYYSCALEVNPECNDIPAHRISGRITAKVN